jgi:tellurite resistance protein TerC
MTLFTQKAIESFQGITLLQLGAFLLPFIIAVWIDLRSHKKGQVITLGNAAKWSAIWVVCALLFGGFIYWNQEAEFASLYLTGYVLEKALAADNLFAFYLIFKSFGLTSHQTCLRSFSIRLNNETLNNGYSSSNSF